MQTDRKTALWSQRAVTINYQKSRFHHLYNKLFQHMSGKVMLPFTLLVCLVFLLSFETTAQRNTVVAYPAPPGLQTSPDFTVKVNNVNIWTEQVGDGGMESLNVANYSC